MRKTIHTDSENQVMQRITEMLIQSGKTQKELTDYLGVTKCTYSDWKSGRTNSYMRYVDKIAEYLDSTYEYIMHGNADDPNEKELIRLYRGLNNEKRKHLLTLAQAM